MKIYFVGFIVVDFEVYFGGFFFIDLVEWKF